MSWWRVNATGCFCYWITQTHASSFVHLLNWAITRQYLFSFGLLALHCQYCYCIRNAFLIHVMWTHEKKKQRTLQWVWTFTKSSQRHSKVQCETYRAPCSMQLQVPCVVLSQDHLYIMDANVCIPLAPFSTNDFLSIVLLTVCIHFNHMLFRSVEPRIYALLCVHARRQPAFSDRPMNNNIHNAFGHAQHTQTHSIQREHECFFPFRIGTCCVNVSRSVYQHISKDTCSIPRKLENKKNANKNWKIRFTEGAQCACNAPYSQNIPHLIYYIIIHIYTFIYMQDIHENSMKI